LSLVVLLTDFGERDGFVGVLKGVMLSINPSLRFIDLTHHIEPFNITEGALVLKAHYRYFSKGSIFLGVVDPGLAPKERR
jgi:S-adenosylmethionine hydrolase